MTRHPVLTIAMLIALAVLALVVAVLAAAAFAVVGHAILVATLGEEAIPEFDNTLGMQVLVLADYAFGIAAGLAVIVGGWRMLV